MSKCFFWQQALSSAALRHDKVWAGMSSADAAAGPVDPGTPKVVT